ncbi:putative ribonuclease H-like domain-containing protein [Tanacetum coccineum]
MDVKSAFLYGTIDKEVYVSQPSGFVDPKFPKKVYKILKKIDFMSVKTACTPIETHKPLVKDEEAADVDVRLYRSMIGSLMYLTASRQDIMFVGRKVSGLHETEDVCKRRRDCQSNESEEVSRLVVRKQEVPEELHIEDLFKTSDQSIPEANFPTIDPKIARDAEIARQLQVDLQAEVERERQREEEASKAAIAETYDEVQAGIDADALAAQRSAEIRSRPPTKSQLRNLMMTYLKNMGGYKHSQLKAKTFAEIQGLYERQKRVIDDFKPIDSDDAVKDSKEAAGVHKQKVLEEPNSTKVEVKKEGHEESIKAKNR